MRIWDAYKIDEAVRTLIGRDDVDTIEWMSNPDHIVLENRVGDIAIFEPDRNRIYSGHYFFKSRGRQAINSGRELLDELFNSCYNISIITGFVPLEHLGARWMSRQLGFTSHGVVQYLDDKHYELFILTKEEFNI